MPGSREERIASALHWIDGRLGDLGIPYQVVGGLAAIAHGSERELNDIDMYVPGNALRRVRPALEGHVSHGPLRYRDEQWDCYFLEIDFAGEEIELAEASRTRYRRDADHPWHAAEVDFDAPVRKEAFGVEVPVMPVERLVEYKRRLDRAVHRADLRALSRARDA